MISFNTMVTFGIRLEPLQPILMEMDKKSQQLILRDEPKPVQKMSLYSIVSKINHSLMKIFPQPFIKTALHGTVFGLFLVLSVAGITYALTFNWTGQSSIQNKSSGDPLTSSGWNLLVTNVDNLNERLMNAETTITSLSSAISPGIIIAFNGTNCPTGWSEYTPARGQFLRGIDKSGTAIDPA